MPRKTKPIPSLHTKHLQLLRLIRDATKSGLYTWAQSKKDKDYYHTKSGPTNLYLHFKWPTYNGEVGSDHDFIDMGFARFPIGTPAFDLALEILAAANPKWQDHLNTLHKQCQTDINLLRNALKTETSRKLRRTQISK